MSGGGGGPAWVGQDEYFGWRHVIRLGWRRLVGRLSLRP